MVVLLIEWRNESDEASKRAYYSTEGRHSDDSIEVFRSFPKMPRPKIFIALEVEIAYTTQRFHLIRKQKGIEMKKVMFSLAMVAVCAWADEAPKKDAEAPAPAAAVQQPAREVKAEKAPWPVWLAFNSTKNIDVIGMRFTFPYGSCEGLTGFDLGLFGRCRYMEGFQLNLIRNEAEDVMTGFQVGVYNTAGRSDLLGVQIGLWNEAQSISGAQVGLINTANSVSGFQVGIVNRCESCYGVQVGAVNVIRSVEPSFLPIVNIGFDSFGTPAY